MYVYDDLVYRTSMARRVKRMPDGLFRNWALLKGGIRNRPRARKMVPKSLGQSQPASVCNRDVVRAQPTSTVVSDHEAGIRSGCWFRNSVKASRTRFAVMLPLSSS